MQVIIICIFYRELKQKRGNQFVDQAIEKLESKVSCIIHKMTYTFRILIYNRIIQEDYEAEPVQQTSCQQALMRYPYLTSCTALLTVKCFFPFFYNRQQQLDMQTAKFQDKIHRSNLVLTKYVPDHKQNQRFRRDVVQRCMTTSFSRQYLDDQTNKDNSFSVKTMLKDNIILSKGHKGKNKKFIG